MSVAMTLLVIAIIAAGATYFFTRTDDSVQDAANANVAVNTNSTTNVNSPTVTEALYTGSVDGIRFSFSYINTLGISYHADTDTTYIFPDKRFTDLAKDEILFDIGTLSDQEVIDAGVSVANAVAPYACSADGPRGSTECLNVSDTQVSNLTTTNGLTYSVFQPTLKDERVIFDANDEPIDRTTTTRIIGPVAYFYDTTAKKYVYFSPNKNHEFSTQEIANAKNIFQSFKILR